MQHYNTQQYMGRQLFGYSTLIKPLTAMWKCCNQASFTQAMQ